ncbi:hypothetical protein [Candidatus Nanohalococcus occultus]|uniref:Uncharacterized protein n=1 Tax=Candidatus Nanohalococcus occultus TaxID=2978047 RepID=A0ABY8CEL7_9ARCH|nr:hypothetical protein SVXNc_0617 [Candidatus Nanohaloarchaeota archaeon SVXNc]
MIEEHSNMKNSWTSPTNPEIADKEYSPWEDSRYSLEELEEDVYNEFNNPAGSPELAANVYREITARLTEEEYVTGEDILEEKTPRRFVEDWS